MTFSSFSNPYYYVLAAVYAYALVCAIRVLSDRRSPAAAIGWLLALLVMPFFGIIFYHLIGPTRLTGYIRRRKKRLAHFEEFARGFEERLLASAKPPVEPATALRVVYSRFRKMFQFLGPMSSPFVNRALLLTDGPVVFDQIFRAIERANHYIFVQYYILRSDRLGIELKELLIAKAKRGIPVFVLVDDMGSFWLSRGYIRDLKRAGVHVSSFLPITQFRKGLQINFRNHRKLVVVDGRVAFTGGLNVGDEYAGRSKELHWRDTHIMVEGPAVLQLEEIFFEDWFFTADKSISVKNLIRLTEEARRPFLDDDLPETREFDVEQEKLGLPLKSKEGLTFPHRRALVQVIPSGPTDPWYTNTLLFTELINTARERLWIASPYFVPDATLERALELAIMRGVDVRILIPKESDHPVVQWVSLLQASEVKRRGADVYLYRKGFMHQKVLLVDKVISCIGTTNFDNRAMYLNFETSLVIHDEIFNSDVATMLESDFGASLRLQQSDLKEESPLIKLRGNIARLLSPLL